MRVEVWKLRVWKKLLKCKLINYDWFVALLLIRLNRRSTFRSIKVANRKEKYIQLRAREGKEWRRSRKTSPVSQIIKKILQMSRSIIILLIWGPSPSSIFIPNHKKSWKISARNIPKNLARKMVIKALKLGEASRIRKFRKNRCLSGPRMIKTPKIIKINSQPQEPPKLLKLKKLKINSSIYFFIVK